MATTRATKTTLQDLLADTPCVVCDDLYPAARKKLGYPTCPACGERMATEARSKWTVAQEYNKGNYQLITDPATLRGTNPKRTM